MPPRRPRPKPERVKFQDFDITIENPAGSVRSGVDAKGNPWAVRMLYPYGFINRTKGADGEGVDCFIGPDPDARNVYVVHQNKSDGSGEYDEDKTMLGWPTADSAKLAYLLNYSRGGFYRSMTIIPVEQFREQLTNAKPGSVKWKKKHNRNRTTDAIFSASFNPEEHPRGGYPENVGEFSPVGEPYVEWYKKNPPPKIPEYSLPDLSHLGPKPAGGGNEEQQAKYRLWKTAADKFLKEHRAAYDTNRRVREEEWRKRAKEADAHSPEGIARAQKEQKERDEFLKKHHDNIEALKWAEANAYPSQRPSIQKIRESLERASNIWGSKDIRAAWFKGARAFAEKRLKQLGWKMEHRSESGSVYYRSPDGEKLLRLSNHDLGFGDYGSRQQVHHGPEIVLGEPMSQQELRDTIGEEIDEETFCAIAASSFKSEEGTPGDWITVGGRPEMRGGKLVQHAGGARVEIKGGRIDKGPKELKGKPLSSLNKTGKTPIEHLMERMKQKKMEEAARIHPSLRTPEQHALLSPPAKAEMKGQPAKPAQPAPQQPKAAPPGQAAPSVAAPAEERKWWQVPPKTGPWAQPAAATPPKPKFVSQAVPAPTPADPSHPAHPLMDRQTKMPLETEDQQKAREQQEQAAQQAQQSPTGEQIPVKNISPRSGLGQRLQQILQPPGEGGRQPTGQLPSPGQASQPQGSAPQVPPAPQGQLPAMPAAPAGQTVSPAQPSAPKPRVARKPAQAGGRPVSKQFPDIPAITPQDFDQGGWDGVEGWAGLKDDPNVAAKIANGMRGLEGKEYGVMQWHGSGKWVVVSRPAQAGQTTQATPQGTSPAETPATEEPTEAAQPESVRQYSKAGIERTLVDYYKSHGGDTSLWDEESLQGFHSPFTFQRDPATKTGFPGEVERFLERPDRAKFRRMFTLTDDPAAAQGPDAMEALGEEGYFNLLERAATNKNPIDAALEEAKKSDDPQIRFLASLYEITPAMGERVPQEVVNPGQLQPGAEFEIHGIPVHVEENAEGEKSLADAGDLPTVPVEAVPSVPMDKGTMRTIEPPEQAGSPFEGLEPEAKNEPAEQPIPGPNGVGAPVTAEGVVQPAGEPAAAPVVAPQTVEQGAAHGQVQPPTPVGVGGQPSQLDELQGQHDRAQERYKNLVKKAKTNPNLRGAAQDAGKMAKAAAMRLHAEKQKQPAPAEAPAVAPPPTSTQQPQPGTTEPQTNPPTEETAPSVPEVDVNRQLGMFEKDAAGNPVEVGVQPGQAALFNPSKYGTQPPVAEAEPKVPPQFDPRHTMPMFPVGEGAGHPFEKASLDEVLAQKKKDAEMRLPPPGENPEDSKTYGRNESKARQYAARHEKQGHYKIDMPVEMLTPGNKVIPERAERLEQIGGSGDPGFVTIDHDMSSGEPAYNVDDGNHRVEMAKRQGKATVPMYVTPEKPEDLERLHRDIENWKKGHPQATVPQLPPADTGEETPSAPVDSLKDKIAETSAQKGQGRYDDDPEVNKAMDRKVRSMWLKDIQPDPSLRNLTDEELQAKRAGLPKDVGAMTPDQQKLVATVWMEQSRRYEHERLESRQEERAKYASAEQIGKWEDGTPFPKEGEKVSSVHPNIMGMPSEINGVVKRTRDGRYYIQITSSGVGGAKTTPLTPQWRTEAGHEFARAEWEKKQEAERPAREAAAKAEADKKAAIEKTASDWRAETQRLHPSGLRPEDLKAGAVVEIPPSVMNGEPMRFRVAYVTKDGGVYGHPVDEVPSEAHDGGIGAIDTPGGLRVVTPGTDDTAQAMRLAKEGGAAKFLAGETDESVKESAERLGNKAKTEDPEAPWEQQYADQVRAEAKKRGIAVDEPGVAPKVEPKPEDAEHDPRYDAIREKYAAAGMAPNVAASNARTMIGILNGATYGNQELLDPNNRNSRRIFQETTGIKLPPTIGGTKQAVEDYRKSQVGQPPTGEQPAAPPAETPSTEDAYARATEARYKIMETGSVDQRNALMKELPEDVLHELTIRNPFHDVAGYAQDEIDRRRNEALAKIGKPRPTSAAFPEKPEGEQPPAKPGMIELKQGWHAKHNRPTYVAQIRERVDRAEYERLKAEA
jgi:hypothetical protein